MLVEVKNLDRRLARYVKPLRDTAEGFFKFYWSGRQERVEIFVVNSLQMRKLNYKYRRQNKPTDVLAVEAPSFPGNESIGEMYINPSTLKKKPYDMEYAAVHGLLHLLGFTHQGKSDKMEMEKLEQQVLKWLKHTS